MTHDQKHDGWTVRSLRVAGGISLRDLASRLKVSAVYLGEIERGKRPVSALDDVALRRDLPGYEEEKDAEERRSAVTTRTDEAGPSPTTGARRGRSTAGAAMAERAPPQLLTLEDAARALSVGYSTLCKMLKRKAIPYVKVNADRRIDAEDLRRFIQANRSQR